MEANMANQDGTNQDQTVDPGIDTRLQTRNIADRLASLEECSTFANLVREADLQYVLRRSGLRTLLAPVNECLTGIRPDNIEEFLERHLLPGGQETFDLRRCREIKTIAGTVLPVRPENGSIRIGNALITRSDIPCTNGVIQIIDATVTE
jgi:uncharacterized surface protein with fasciclin (FAS1) repeats